MSLAKLLRPILAAAFALLVLVGAPISASATATPQPADNPGYAHAQVTTVTYNASRSAEFKQVMDHAAQIWNNSVHNVQLKPSSGNADVTILADNGWPRTLPEGLGRGTIWMGREAVNQGYAPLRIATHELGHIYGLDDHRTGICSELMSGHSAGPQCKNPYPNKQERAEVERNFGQQVTVPRRLFVDAAVQPATVG